MIRKIEYKIPRLFTLYLIMSFFLLQVIDCMYGGSFVLHASNPDNCTENLDQAEEHYYNGEFDMTIKIVNQCLQLQSLSNENQIRSYIILARTYLAKDDTILAKDNIRIILKLDPGYQPTIEQETPKYVNFVAKVKEEQDPLNISEAGIGISSWILIGAGSAAAVAIIAIVASGSGDDKGDSNTSLPKPPDFPE
jgi:hypothetical protein